MELVLSDFPKLAGQTPNLNLSGLNCLIFHKLQGKLLINFKELALTNIKEQRVSSFKKQNGVCYYCGSPMWNKNLEEFAKHNEISVKSAKKFQCTAEHLTAQCDCGSNAYKNIVAACKFCNQTRHKKKKALSPPKYKKYVKRRLSKGKWHSSESRKLSHTAGVMR